MVCESPSDAVAPVRELSRSAAAGPDACDLQRQTVRTRGNLADRSRQHNRRTPAFSTPQFRRDDAADVALTLPRRYARRQRASASDFNDRSRGRHDHDFDKREEGFEKKFAHDEELRFKASARRNKLLGLWAAEKLGMTGADAEAYAKEVVMADFEEAGDNDVCSKVRKDFDAKGRHRAAGARADERTAGAGDRADQEERLTCRHFALARAPARRRNRLLRLVQRSARRIVAETIAREGFAAVMLDAQHGLWDIAATHRRHRRASIMPAPRRWCACRSAISRWCRRALDFGAEGDHRADDQHRRRRARTSSAAAKYPPLGERSWGPHRAP